MATSTMSARGKATNVGAADVGATDVASWMLAPLDARRLSVELLAHARYQSDFHLDTTRLSNGMTAAEAAVAIVVSAHKYSSSSGGSGSRSDDAAAARTRVRPVSDGSKKDDAWIEDAADRRETQEDENDDEEPRHASSRAAVARRVAPASKRSRPTTATGSSRTKSKSPA